MRCCVLAIGNFDGVHLGHAALLAFAANKARQAGVPLEVLTFDPLPGEYFAAQGGQEGAPVGERICTLQQRVQFLTGLGVDAVRVEPFTAVLQRLTPHAFVTSVLASRYAAKTVVVGADFRFGRQRWGDIALLEKLCAKAGIACHIFGLVKSDKNNNKTGHDQEAKYSSSSIRAALKSGDLATANRQLGYSWQLTGWIQKGDGRGTGLGYATANMCPDIPLPGLRGVFVSSLRVQGEWCDAITNIGTRPTFATDRLACETHLLGPSPANLYNLRVTLALHHRLREEKRFGNVDALVRQIDTDIAAARAWHASHNHVFAPHIYSTAHTPAF